jgi:hypothetical protein
MAVCVEVAHLVLSRTRKSIARVLESRSFGEGVYLKLPNGDAAIRAGPRHCCPDLGLMWLIPPARRAMNAEAEGDEEMTFRGANLGLVRLGGIASGIAFLLLITGAATLRDLR